MINTTFNLTVFSIIYFLPIILILTFLRSKEFSKKNINFVWVLSLAFLSFSCFYSLKNFSFGDDFYNYFLISKSLSSWQALGDLETDKIFWFFLYVFSIFSDNSYFFSFIFSIFFFAFVVLASISFDKKILILALFCILFSRAFIESTVNPLRSSMALMILFFAYNFLHKKSFIPTIVLILLSYGIHQQITLFMGLIFLLSYLNLKLVKLGFLSSFIVFLFINNFSTPSVDFFNEYLSQGDKINSLSLPFNYLVQIFFPVLVPIIFLWNKEMKSEFHIQIFKLILIIMSLLVVSISFSPLVLRFGILLIPLSLYLFFDLLETRSSKISYGYMLLLLTFNYFVIVNNIIGGKYFFDTQQTLPYNYEIIYKDL